MSKEDWDKIIKPKTGWFDLPVKDLYKYRDLILLFVKRDFVTFYKQTILGPLWYIIQPLVNTIIFTVIFGRIAKIPTDGTPPFLFYMAGTVVWGYFSVCIIATSNTFVNNAGIFGKVYFPRLCIPLSIVITGLVQFMIQFLIFLCFYLYYWIEGADVKPTYWVMLLPLIIIQMMILGLGVGIFISSLVTKYRDLTFAMSFGVQLWMYVTPIVYPMTQVPEQYHVLYAVNPMVSIVELFRLMFFGVSSIQLVHIVTSIVLTMTVFVFGVLLFSKIEKTFMDTV